MRKRPIALGLLAGFAATAALAASQSTPAPYLSAVRRPTNAVATAAVQISGQAYVDATFDVWSTGPVTRWNRSRVHRLEGVTSTSVTFAVASRAGSFYRTLAIVVDGALATTYLATADDVERTVTVTGLAAGSKTVEIWEPFQQRGGSLNSNADSTIFATYVTWIDVPLGATFVKQTAATGIIVGLDSLCDGVADEPLQWNGWCGQLRRAAQAAGQLVAYYDYGSGTLAGDGRTPAQMAADCDRQYTAMGTTTPKLVMLVRPNDWAYYQQSGFGVTAAQYGTAFAAFLDALRALRPTLVVDIINTLPQSTGQPVGADTLAQFRTAISGLSSGRSWVTIHDGTAATPTGPGLSLVTDYDHLDQVHPLQVGQDKIFAWVRAFPNISLRRRRRDGASRPRHRMCARRRSIAGGRVAAREGPRIAP